MNKIPNLPDKIRVKVTKGGTGVFIAELKDFDIFTEADSEQELILNVNDLVYTYFDVPKSKRSVILYHPPLLFRTRVKRSIPSSLVFQKYYSSVAGQLHGGC